MKLDAILWFCKTASWSALYCYFIISVNNSTNPGNLQFTRFFFKLQVTKGLSTKTAKAYFTPASKKKKKIKYNSILYTETTALL